MHIIKRRFVKHLSLRLCWSSCPTCYIPNREMASCYWQSLAFHRLYRWRKLSILFHHKSANSSTNWVFPTSSSLYIAHHSLSTKSWKPLPMVLNLLNIIMANANLVSATTRSFIFTFSLNITSHIEWFTIKKKIMRSESPKTSVT